MSTQVLNVSLTATPLHAPAHAGVHPHGLLQLARLVFLGLPLFRFFTLLGLGLLPVAVIGWFFSPLFAFGVGIYLWICVLFLPYIIAPPMLRSLLGQRRLGLVPGFAFNCGLLLLLMVLALSAAPLLAWLAGIPNTSLLGLRVFIAASAYTGLLMLILPSRHAPALFATLPIMIFLGLRLLAPRLLPLWFNPALLLVLFAVAVAGWALWLLRLRGPHQLAPVQQQFSGSAVAGRDYQQALQLQPWLYRFHRPPAAPSLLLGHPAGWGGRALQIAHLVLMSPLLCTAMIWLMGNADDGAQAPLKLFFLFHLGMIAFVTFSWGELPARARLLWLRLDGDRRAQWAFLERQLWCSYAVMTGITLTLLLTATLLTDMVSTWPWAVLALAASLHNGYFGVLQRLRGWSGWTQLLYLLLTSGIIGACTALAYGLQFAQPALAAVPVLLALTWLYRHLAAARFATVDWLKLKPARLSRNTAAG